MAKEKNSLFSTSIYIWGHLGKVFCIPAEHITSYTGQDSFQQKGRDYLTLAHMHVHIPKAHVLETHMKMRKKKTPEI